MALPTKRVTFQLKKISESKWLPSDMLNLINNLPDVKALPKQTQEREALAYIWDSLISEMNMSRLLLGFDQDIITIPEIGNYLKVKYLDKWNRSYDALMSTYNPIENYSMTETDDFTGKSTTNGTIDITKSNTTTNNLTKVLDETKSNTTTVDGKSDNTTTDNSSNGSDTTRNVYGYDNGTATPDSSETNTTTESTTSVYAGTTKDTTTGNDKTSATTTDTGTVSDQGKDTTTNNDVKDDTTHRSLTRKGNIGVTTSQQMIESELVLRRNILLDEIFKDIKNEFTLSIY